MNALAKLLSVLLSVVMILPCMTSIAWATTTDEKENESTPSVITDEATSVVPEPTLPEALDMSTVPIVLVDLKHGMCCTIRQAIIIFGLV